MFKITLRPLAVNFDFDSHTECDHTCDNGDICRCSVLTDIHADSIDLGCTFYVEKEQITQTKKGDKHKWKECKFTQMEAYCVDRLQRIYKMYELPMWEVSTTWGYYGQEIDYDSLTHPQLDNCKASIIKMLELPDDITKVKHVLTAEYCHLLPEVEKCTTVKKTTVPLSDLYGQNEYFSRLKKSLDGYQYNKQVQCQAVTIGNRIIDGYHRLSNCKSKVVNVWELQ